MYVTLHVTDQERALRFCTERPGLEKRIDHPGPEGRFLTVGVPGLVFLESDDLRADFKVLRDRGVTLDQPEPEDYGLGVRSEAVDPDGNRISLRQRAAWQGRSEG
ncbi:glyoxalase [Kitasatospora sp. NPDC101801]|uniref:glyoxalase n=1 Tax=Kitasatospora sp. NPDC101801 TaxID=3364103 RepID=UPI0038160B89